MPKPWKEGDAIPEGFLSDTVIGAGAAAILHGMALRTAGPGDLDVEKMIRAWQNTIRLNGPENSAALLMAACALAGGAYIELAALKGTPPADLVRADAEMAEAVLAVIFGDR